MLKKILWIGLLCALILWVLWLYQQPNSQQQDMDVWPNIAQDKVVGLQIDQGNGTRIVLQLSDGQWQLASGAMAVQDAVWHLLDDVLHMSPIRVVTREHKHDAALGMLDAVQLRCLGKNDEVLLGMSIGKQGSDLLSTYVRLDGSDAIVAINRSLLWQVKRSPKSWQAVKKP